MYSTPGVSLVLTQSPAFPPLAHCQSQHHKNTIPLRSLPIPVSQCHWKSHSNLSVHVQRCTFFKTHSEWDAATLAASAASLPRSLQYPSSSSNFHMFRTCAIASAPLMRPSPHPLNCSYASDMASSLLSEARDSASGNEHTLHWHWKQYCSARNALEESGQLYLDTFVVI